jgi:hypothetical protein
MTADKEVVNDLAGAQQQTITKLLFTGLPKCNVLRTMGILQPPAVPKAEVFDTRCLYQKRSFVRQPNPTSELPLRDLLGN